MGKTKKGYYAADFLDTWKRYLPPAYTIRDEGDEGEEIDNKNKNLADIAPIAPTVGKDSDPFASLKDPSLKFERRH
jgi:hypothetical protein